jgi:adenosylmethionine-8-amino-7-oxononanoate aminotransferase
MQSRTDPSLAARSLSCVWHPCTQMRDHEWLPLLAIARAQGAWLEDNAGRRYLDAISSWWTCLFGHGHAPIISAISQQAARLDHVLLGGCTHEPVVRLTERLLTLAPPGLAHAHYASDGSSAVEIALKLSFHYWRNLGQPARRRFLCLEGSYHGETLGALAVGDVGLYRDSYAPLLLQPLTVPSPAAPPGTAADAAVLSALAALQAALERHAHEVCALILEPLVQCAGGMRMYPPSFLRGAHALCAAHGVHLIADEIATGMGRTGSLFACEQAGITPDFLLLGKGLTGGLLPLSVCLTTAVVYQAFYADYAAQRAFLHSHSYSGNPIACAAALAVLDEFERRPVLADNRALAAHLAAAAAPLARHPHVAQVRQTGMMLAIELARDGVTPYPWQERRGLRVYQHGLTQGALLRPLGNVVYWMPPYCITPQEIETLGRVTLAGIEAATT